MSDVLNPKDIMEILDIGRRQTYELLENPPFRVVRVGRLIKISKKSFYNWLDGEQEQVNYK
ncbi:DNA-binding protein [Oceanobacillus oncorhynchi subsp. oncorhynchi]|uniref:DNA-binding protein n=1 Tax=Oceanobacillus oncorhynchi TaxID=545501 RepID=UPI003627233A